ncbi:NAD(P)H:quinone oxidoreductase [Pedobacter antarcticus]|uniref:NAD(P)H:quinone oxidoreductase n=1 Tax=Pedobacter antarcticus TaxID=34086 RepID=UPI002930D9F3|nr:NAD(P)H:quinone oxidoreductase [Pedobacter antarcticus]
MKSNRFIKPVLIALSCLSLVLTSNSTQAASYMKPINTEIKILVLFNSENGSTYRMAQAIANGIDSYPGAKAVLKQVPRIKSLKDEQTKSFAAVPYATINELPEYDGIAFGSAVHFGNMTADMRYFLDQSVTIWTQRKLEGIPATVFMSAGSGAGREGAILSFWNTLAVHGMLIVPAGINGSSEIDQSVPQGNTVFGASSLTGNKMSPRPSDGELYIARLQGYALAKAAKGHRLTSEAVAETIPDLKENQIEAKLKALNIELPQAPAPVGNYKPYRISGNQVFINQVALIDGKIAHPGIIGTDLSQEQAKEATRQTMLNVLSVLKQATGGDLNRVRQAVQLTGFFNTAAGYAKHAVLMNEASNLLVEIMGESGMHTRGTVGASSLPLNSAVEIQAVFELKD